MLHDSGTNFCVTSFFSVFFDTHTPEFASTGTSAMKANKGDALEHPVTEVEAIRSILVQEIPLLDQELTESSIVQVSG